MKLDFETIQSAFLKKGYTLHPSFNIVGIRTRLEVPDAFNDFIGIVMPDKKEAVFFEGTTDPGLHWKQNPMNAKGTAFLVPGQYKNTWKIGIHGKGVHAHEALVQIRPVSVYRDNSKSMAFKIDSKTKDVGLFGINIHSTGIIGFVAPNVQKWSAGCQVIRRYDTFKNKFMPLVKQSKLVEFTYTLLDEIDLY